MNRRRGSWLVAVLGIATLTAWMAPLRALEDTEQNPGVNCSFKSDPDEFLSSQSRARRGVFDRTSKVRRTMAAGEEPVTVASSSIPRRNFIDDEILGKLDRLGVSSARLSNDEEFARRIHLDLTGRIPSPEEIRSFVADSNPAKRDLLIDRLLFSPEFTDKWAMWMGDLFQNNRTSASVARQSRGRNAYYNWIVNAVANEKSFKDVAWEAVTGAGNVYDDPTAAANFVLNGRMTGGPAEDTYDMMLVKSATAFLGVAYYDCVLCHDGRGHLDQISLWGKSHTRADAQRMAAFFSRTRLSQPYNARGADITAHYYNSWLVSDVATGTYSVNTNYGNRPNRIPFPGNIRTLNPEYRLSYATPSSANWRAAFADNLTKDPLFPKNFVNRLWKAMFNLGLVDPVDTLDPDRLDSKKTPAAGWSHQATHPELLDKLAEAAARNNYNLRETLRLIALSSAYQLSSRYDGEWKLEYVPLFARHYVRRLEGEEVHDAIQKATGVLGRYVPLDWAEGVQWAMKLPDTQEPLSNRAIATFMDYFSRGNRDTQQRNQAGSIQQQLALMNDNFVINRMRANGANAAPTLQAVSRITDNKAAVEEIFLLFLSRKPTAGELEQGSAYLAGRTAAARLTAIEDLAWACVNKVDFLFSY